MRIGLISPLTAARRFLRLLAMGGRCFCYDDGGGGGGGDARRAERGEGKTVDRV